MRIKLINPNTTASMTQKMGETAQLVAQPNTEIISVNPNSGPVSIESHFDEAISVIGVLEEIQKGEKENIDGYIIACFGDPGLLAARELTQKPVIGIAEAAFHIATLLATRFSIVTTMTRTIIIAEHLLQNYGMQSLCSKVRAAAIPVLDLEHDAGHAYQKIIDECLLARDEDRAGAIVLGCGGMADLADILSREIQLPVIDGVRSAVKLVEGLVGLGLGTSKYGDLDYPIAKKFTGNFAHLSR